MDPSTFTVIRVQHCGESLLKISFYRRELEVGLCFEEAILGINVQSLTQMACDARMMDADARAATVQTIAGHMEDALEIQREVHSYPSNNAASRRYLTF